MNQLKHEGQVAWSYVAMYVEACLTRLSARPKGAYGVSDANVDRLPFLLSNAEAAGVDPKTYVTGIVDQLRFEGRPPIHCLSVCGDAGAEVYRRYSTRIKREVSADAATAGVERDKDMRAQILIEISQAKATITSIRWGRSRKTTDDWQQILADEKYDKSIRNLDAMGHIPASFKYLAKEDWRRHGRSLPSVGREYVSALMDPSVVQAFESAFPRATANVCCF